MNGVGEFSWPDSNRYIGFYKDNKKHGIGLFFNNSKRAILINIWNEGIRDGPCIIYKNSIITYSFWKEGQRTKRFNDLLVFNKYLHDNYQLYKKIFRKHPKEIIAMFTNNLLIC